MIKNYLTIDVEDYYQVSAFEGIVKHTQWSAYPSRIERNVHTLLEILSEHDVSATFFVLGWIAEKFPQVVHAISRHNHEIGCHSYWHQRIYTLSPQEFESDTRRAKDILEQMTGKAVSGYRAPSYSITAKSLWALDILEKLGFKYDSSIFPITHDIYGMPNTPRFKYQIPNHAIIEYPPSTIRFLGRNFPVGGGGYFRLIPYGLIRRALRHINEKEDQVFLFYLHPWEIDPEQPRMKKASYLSKFRHYVNLGKTASCFRRLLEDFQFVPIEEP